MPWKMVSVPSDVFITYKGVTVYHTYVDGDYDDGPRSHCFSLYPSDDEGDPRFDVRELIVPGRPNFTQVLAQATSENAAIKAHLCAAIDAGVLNATPGEGEVEPLASSGAHDVQPPAEVVYLCNALGEPTGFGELTDADAAKVPFDGGPGSVLVYPARVDGALAVLGNLEFGYGETWGVPFEAAQLEADRVHAAVATRVRSPNRILPVSDDGMHLVVTVVLLVDAASTHAGIQRELERVFGSEAFGG